MVASPSRTHSETTAPIDFSPASERALDYACSLGASLGATVHLVNALGTLPELSVTLTDAMLRSLRDGHHNALARLADPRRALVTIGQTLVKEGDPRDVVLETIDELRIDLIVMGTHGRRGISRMLMGSVAEDVTRRATCPVLLVRMKEGAA